MSVSVIASLSSNASALGASASSSEIVRNCHSRTKGMKKTAMKMNPSLMTKQLRVDGVAPSDDRGEPLSGFIH